VQRHKTPDWYRGVGDCGQLM